MDQKNREDIIVNGSEKDLSELRLFLFKESCRIENQESMITDEWDKLEKEKEMLDTKWQEYKSERANLEHEKVFFEEKLSILNEGFKKLDDDRQELEKLKKKLDLERRLLDEDALLLSEKEEQIDAYGCEILFKGISDNAKLKKRYKALLKIFHPDNLNGDDEIVRIINKEYENLLDSFEDLED